MTITCSACGASNFEDAAFCTTCAAMPIVPQTPSSGNFPPPSQSLTVMNSPPPDWAAGPDYSSPRPPIPPPQYFPPPHYQPGMAVSHGQPINQPINVIVMAQGKSKIAAALLAFFLGGLGVHRFYLGYTGTGITQLMLLLGGFVTCGATSYVAGFWAFIDFIRILTGSISKDAQGNPLI